MPSADSINFTIFHMMDLVHFVRRPFPSAIPLEVGGAFDFESGGDGIALLHTRRGSCAFDGVKLYNLSGFL